MNSNILTKARAHYTHDGISRYMPQQATVALAVGRELVYVSWVTRTPESVQAPCVRRAYLNMNTHTSSRSTSRYPLELTCYCGHSDDRVFFSTHLIYKGYYYRLNTIERPEKEPARVAPTVPTECKR